MLVGGEEHHVIVIPDGDSEVVNVDGNHSVRGGALAQKLYTATGATSDRLKFPLLRVGGTLTPISWETATDLVARLAVHTIDTYRELAFGIKIYFYEFYENVFAASKLGLGKIGTPNWSPHHAPAEGDDVPGLTDSGIDAFSASFEDDRAADVLFIAGSDPYETKTVRFTSWQAVGGAVFIYVDPRRTFTAAYAEENGGLHLQINPGTNCLPFTRVMTLPTESPSCSTVRTTAWSRIDLRKRAVTIQSGAAHIAHGPGRCRAGRGDRDPAISSAHRRRPRPAQDVPFWSLRQLACYCS